MAIKIVKSCTIRGVTHKKGEVVNGVPRSLEEKLVTRGYASFNVKDEPTVEVESGG